MPARCDVLTDKHFNGVCIRVVEFDTHGVTTNSASVVYTPELARAVAREIAIEADKIEALGGPTSELSAACTPAVRNETGGN